MALQVKSTKIMTETKTHDNVIVNVETTVLYRIDSRFIDKAFFKLTDERGQIGSYVVRAQHLCISLSMHACGPSGRPSIHAGWLSVAIAG